MLTASNNDKFTNDENKIETTKKIGKDELAVAGFIHRVNKSMSECKIVRSN